MHLTSIRLRGFKSFPDAVEVRLEPGVAVVVGPNGSGKSNVADAILWAAGSLAPSELRAEKPDDVLFAGSAGRPPVDHCEVELVFDNADGGIGGLDYSEVSIARRLHRGGEGQYLINGASVRRTDVVELLADVGLGSAMGAVVSQGRVEAILTSKPVERRALVEEAAGLGRFKRQRHRAELKLTRVAQQVERARDVEQEVAKRLRPLALQASAAERAERLAAEIATLRAGLAQLDLARLEAEAQAVRGRIEAVDEVRDAVDARLAGVVMRRAAVEEELADAAGGREAAVAELYRLRSASERIGMRAESAVALQEDLHSELAEAQRLAAGLPEALAGLARARADAEQAAAAEAAARSSAVAAAAASGGAIAAAGQAARRQAAEELEALSGRRSAAEADLARETTERESALGEVYLLRGARDRVSVRRDAIAELRGRAGEELAEVRALAAIPGPTPEELERRADEATAAARAAVQERDALAGAAAAAGEQVDALARSLAARDGLSPAARSLAAEGATLALAMLQVEPGRERAVAAALDSRASALVARDGAEALGLVQRAAAGGLGSVRVLVGQDPAELVRAVPVVPVEELLSSQVPAVTPEGYGWDPVRGELWFAGAAAEAVLLELDSRRRALAVEAEQLARRAAAAAAGAAAAVAWADEAEAAYAEAAPRRRHRVSPAALERIVEVAAGAEAALAGALDRALTAEAALARAAEQASERVALLGAELRAMAEAEQDARGRSAAAAEREAGIERELRRLGAEPAAGGDPEAWPELVAAAHAATRRADEAAARARAAAAAHADALPRSKGAGAAALAGLIGAGERLVAALTAAAAAAERFQEPLRARVDHGVGRAHELAAELRALGSEEAEVRRELAGLTEQASAGQVGLARLDAESADARRRLAEAAAEPAAGDAAELGPRLERAERQHAAIAAAGINPFAKEEHAAEKERLDELRGQREDLERSLEELAALRDDLTRTVESRFEETFAAVERHFAATAATLFPGGEGRLRLTEPDEEGGEPGIEVELRPAGKRVTRLTLLSGGEKALGAISFLFALFLSRPSPFYLLDEVEAALDDANIGRFVDLLRRFAGHAQFIVVTHQKRTMEAADVLYGVTMGQEGVSQIVSRRLPHEDQAASAA